MTPARDLQQPASNLKPEVAEGACCSGWCLVAGPLVRHTGSLEGTCMARRKRKQSGRVRTREAKVVARRRRRQQPSSCEILLIRVLHAAGSLPAQAVVCLRHARHTHCDGTPAIRGPCTGQPYEQQSSNMDTLSQGKKAMPAPCSYKCTQRMRRLDSCR